VSSPRVRTGGATALAAVLVGVAGWLGWWQLQAWEARRDAEARDLTALTPVGIEDVMGPDDPFPGDQVGRPVEVRGEWLPEGTFFVSDRVVGDEQGYWAVVPLAVGGAGEPAIPVVVGWSTEPTLPEPLSGEAEVTGWLQPPEGTGAVDDDPDDDVVPQLRIADAVQRVDVDLYGAYLVARDPAPDLTAAGLDQLPEVGRFTALRNLLYATEWWFFGAFAAFIWWRWMRDERLRRDAEDPSVD
jgi:cytochrome oxidase assembly protein ShyY1